MSKQIKIIFLDIDGVLVTLRSFRKFKVSGSRAKADPDCVAALNKITEATGAVFVISSTWRYFGIMQVKESLASWGVTGKTISITPRFDDQPQEFRRSAEIAYWLNTNERYDVESYIILDDEQDDGTPTERFVKTVFEDGLTMQHAEMAIQLLHDNHTRKAE